MNYPVARGDRRQWLAAAVTILILVGGMMAVWVMSRAPLEPVDSIAAAETPDGASSGGDDGAAGPVHISVLEIWWRFAVLLTAIYGIGMGIKWFKTRREEMGQEMESSNQAGPAMVLCDSVELDDSCNVHLLQVEDELLVIGSSNRRLALLAQLRRQAASVVPEAEPGQQSKRRREPTGVPLRAPGVSEWEWAQRRAELISALQQQVND